MTMEDFFAKAKCNIRETGRTVLFVADIPSFAYTIGNSLRDLPELIVFGLSPSDSTLLLNAWSNLMIKRGASFGDGEMVQFDESSTVLPCRAIFCPRTAKRYTVQVGQILSIVDAACDLMQMLVPDKRGVFPDDPRCEPPYTGMPVLSARRPS